MSFSLRKHQEECLQDCLNWIRRSVEPAVVEASVSFGKSILIAVLAKEIVNLSKKKVLILCPSSNLVKQNSQKVRENGDNVSVFSAGLGQKSLRHDIVVGTPQTIKNSLSRFGESFSSILIDEGEGLTNAVRAICEKIKEENPLVRIIGFTGTPYRTGTGYVYRIDEDGTTLGDHQTINPFYLKCIHKTRTQDLMDEGYLTPMVIGEVMAEKYHTSELVANAQGRFNAKAVDQAYHGHGRVTSSIVADIVRQSVGKRGVMIFGATVQHVKEIYASLPSELTRMVYGGNPDNAKNIEDFKRQRYKYIVNLDMLTVGADFPHVDVIALLRKTESTRLLQQILGRGVRLDLDNWTKDKEPPTVELRKQAIANGKKPFCLYLDYTEDNMSTHFPDGDLWNPVIEARLAKAEAVFIKCKCPDCGTENEYTARKNDEEYPISEDGYFEDLDGNKIMSEHGAIPAHYGRRCYGMIPKAMGVYEQCEYRYTSKECPHCNEPNDIAARYCIECKGEIVNPGDKLISEYRALVRSPNNRQCNVVEAYSFGDSVTRSGRECWRVNFKTPYRSFTIWIMKDPKGEREYYDKKLWESLDRQQPKTVEYQKDGKSNFYRVYSYNKQADEEPET